MPDESEPTDPALPDGVPPDEMFARAMQTVRMTHSGGAHGWEPPDLAEIARLFPNYEVLRLLGRGGMGAVYQARQTALDRLVAIKLLPLEVSVDQAFADRFRREAQAMAKLNHPHIIGVYEFGTTSEGHLFIVMEYVEGANLSDIIHQVGLEPDQALSVVEQVCAALGYAHGKGVVHRDIKPANVMIDTESQVKVADFGLARLLDAGTADLGHTLTGTVMGTPDYMAPEQTKGMNVDHRADIYSLGVMIYEMLCREVPKGAFQTPSARTGCDVRIDGIVIKAMQQAPDHRYQSTGEMKADVTAVRTPPAPPKPLPKPPARAKAAPAPASAPPVAKSRTPLYAGIAVLAVALIGGAIYFTKAKPNARTENASSAKATALATATKDAPFVNTLGMKFVPVPGTKVLFSVWETRVQDFAVFARETGYDAASEGANGTRAYTLERTKDGHSVDGLGVAWTQAGGSWKDPHFPRAAPQTEDAPVCCVSYFDAEAFCAWLTKRERAEGLLSANWKYRLPGDAEWDSACGTAEFPWGDYWPPKGDDGNYNGLESGIADSNNELVKLGYKDDAPRSAKVGSFKPNLLGLYDMGGNVWEWTSTLWRNEGGGNCLVRGASWNVGGRVGMQSGRRYVQGPDLRRDDFGFRCVLAPAP